jgi:hypothetical protein
MKKKRFILFFLAMLALILMACSPMPALVAAAGVPLPTETFNIVVMIMLGFASLIGVSKLIAALINLLKTIGVVKDGTSAKWAAALNLLAFIALVLLGVFRPDLTTELLDGYAGQIAAILLFVLGFISQIVGSQSAHEALSDARVPLIGKSYSRDA